MYFLSALSSVFIPRNPELTEKPIRKSILAGKNSYGTWKNTTLIAVSSGRGAKDGRCAKGPGALRADGLAPALRAKGFEAAWGKGIPPASGGLSQVESVARVCERLAETIESMVKQERFAVVLGGDHSCAIGTWSGAARALSDQGPLGLIWIDAHMDSHIPETSPSGSLHGMGLACLLGFGDRRLTDIAGERPALEPRHVCLIGVRSYEPEEAALLDHLGVRVFPMKDIAAVGFEQVLDEAIGIASAGTAGFGVSIDLDAIDPRDAPGVGSPTPDGLRAGDLLPALKRLRREAGFFALEVCEFNPDLDHEGLTAALVESLLSICIPRKGGHYVT